MAAAFLIARQRGLDELASQVGFFVVINLVITFSIPNISIGGHLGGLIGGGLAALLLTTLERRRVPNAKLIEALGLDRPLRDRLRRRAAGRRLGGARPSSNA